MKVLNFKSNSIQEKNNISTDIQKIKNIDNKSNHAFITDDIQIKNFKSIVSKIKIDETLDLESIERLRNEIKNKTFTTEQLADSLIKNIKESSWRERF